MDPLHVHLFINHLPIAGTILGAFVLILTLWFRSKHTEIAAYALFILSSLGAVVAYLTGEGAEHAVRHIPGIVKDTIEQHEHFSIYALVALIILGIASVAGIIQIQQRSTLVKKVPYMMLILSVICFGLISWTAYLGGQIRHTELNNSDTSVQSQPYRDESFRKLP